MTAERVIVMDSRKTYWFDQPYMPGTLNFAVEPIIDPRDGRLCFLVPGYDGPPWGGIWHLTGKLVKDEDDYFEFRCEDSVMHKRGGLYKFTALNLRDFRKETYKWMPRGKTIVETCGTTDELYDWYHKNWPNPCVNEICEEKMEKSG